MKINDSIYLLWGVVIISVAVTLGQFYEDNRDIKFARHLTEALYEELGYKYDNGDFSGKFMHDEDSWLTSMKKEVIGHDGEFIWFSDKSLLERVHELENKKK